MTWEYYVKSRKAEDYRQMLLENLYHPPHIEIDQKKGKDNSLYLVHLFEGKPLVEEFIANTMIGIEYLWGAPVHLETSEVESINAPKSNGPAGGTASLQQEPPEEPEVKWRRVLYTMKDRELSKTPI